MAAREQHSVLIDQPLEEVFAYITDVNNNSLWQSSTLETEQTSEGAVGVGTSYRSVSKFLGRRIETTLEVTEHEPPRKQCVRVTSGPIPAISCYLLEPADGGTRFTQTLEAEAGGFFRLAEPLVARAYQRQMHSDMATLKDLLEARGAQER